MDARCEKLIHTRRMVFDEKFVIVPIVSREVEVDVNIICEEYDENKLESILLNIT